ncbi:MAG: STAS domain-containing protein [Bacillota bacterium]
MGGDLLNFDTENKEIAILKYDGEITFDNSNPLKEEAKEKISKTDYKKLIINLENVAYIDSSGIGFILSIFKFMRERSGNLIIVNANEKIKQGFEITKISDIIKIFDNLEEGFDYLRNN